MPVAEILNPIENKTNIPFGIDPEIFALLDLEDTANLETAQIECQKGIYSKLIEFTDIIERLPLAGSVTEAKALIYDLKFRLPAKVATYTKNINSIKKLQTIVQFPNQKFNSSVDSLVSKFQEANSLQELSELDLKMKSILTILNRFDEIKSQIATSTIPAKYKVELSNLEKNLAFASPQEFKHIISAMEAIISKFDQAPQQAKELSLEAKTLIGEIKDSVVEFKISGQQEGFLNNFIESLQDPTLTIAQIEKVKSDFYVFLGNGKRIQLPKLQSPEQAGDLQNDSRLQFANLPKPETIAKKISNARKNILLKFGGIATAALGIGMALNNTFKQPEISSNPVIPEQPQVTQTFKPTRKPNGNTETINKAPKVEITSNPVTSPSLMKFNFSAQKIEGTISNTTEFNLNSLIKLIKNGGFDSGNILGKLINDKDGSIDPRRVQNLTDNGILQYKLEKGTNGKDQVRFTIDLTSTSFKFAKQKSLEIKTAQQLQREQKDKKTVV